ncbi:MAG: hypothetical protein RLZZ596_1579 [Pseudomonadota bacterium]|jgi:hypothetical protein
MSKITGLIKAVWLGDVPLVISYWIFGVLFSNASVVLFYEVANAFNSRYFLILVVLYASVCWIWILFGVWRSAGKYKGRKAWRYLARVAVILGVFFSIPHIILAVLQR